MFMLYCDTFKLHSGKLTVSMSIRFSKTVLIV